VPAHGGEAQHDPLGVVAVGALRIMLGGKPGQRGRPSLVWRLLEARPEWAADAGTGPGVDGHAVPVPSPDHSRGLIDGGVRATGGADDLDFRTGL
jgi:hypothetical protein